MISLIKSVIIINTIKYFKNYLDEIFLSRFTISYVDVDWLNDYL
jgi:hypothetical protein